MIGANAAQRTVQGPDQQPGQQEHGGAATRTVHYGGDLLKEVDTTASTTTIRTYLTGRSWLPESPERDKLLTRARAAATAGQTAFDSRF
jgi:hypothetical protein